VKISDINGGECMGLRSNYSTVMFMIISVLSKLLIAHR